MSGRDDILAGWDAALESIAAGEPPFRLCRRLGWPWATFSRMTAEEGRADAYARAREDGWHAMARECQDIADDGTGDTWTDDEGKERVNQDHIQRSRLRVDTRKWLLSKMLPKVYGEKQAVELSGKDGAPLVVKFQTGMQEGDEK